MTEGPPARPSTHVSANVSTNALGVVDPLRVPGLDRALRYWGGLPVLAKVFVGLAVIDTVARAMGFLGQSLGLELAIPITLFTAFLPHTALILLPAIILARRHDAGRVAPLVLRGAIVVALVELLIGPISSIGESSAGLPGWAIVSIGGNVGVAAGWVAMAVGLAALRQARPSSAVAGSSNVVAGAIALGAITSLAVLVVGERYDYGDSAWNAFAGLAAAASLVSTLALAFLARVLVRGIADPGRPQPATTTGAVAASLWGMHWLLILGVNLAVIVQAAFAWPLGATAGMLALGWIGDGFATAALVLAFALGLAEPARDEASEEAPEREAGPAWPPPGGEVPTYR